MSRKRPNNNNKRKRLEGCKQDPEPRPLEAEKGKQMDSPLTVSGRTQPYLISEFQLLELQEKKKNLL